MRFQCFMFEFGSGGRVFLARNWDPAAVCFTALTRARRSMLHGLVVTSAWLHLFSFSGDGGGVSGGDSVRSGALTW